MPYYPQEGRRGLFPMSRQRFESPMPNSFPRLRGSFYASYPFDPRQGQQQFNPYQ